MDKKKQSELRGGRLAKEQRPIINESAQKVCEAKEGSWRALYDMCRYLQKRCLGHGADPSHRF